MKNTFILNLFIVFLFNNKSIAQSNKDTLNFLSAKWEITKLNKDLIWKHYQFKEKELFNSNQNIHIIIAKRKTWFNPHRSKPAFISDGDSLELTSILAKNNNALVAINGSFFDVKKGGAVDFIRVNSQILDSTIHNGKRLAEHQMSALIINKNHRISIEHTRDSADFRWETRLNAPNVLVTGPLLIFEGKPYPLSKSAFNDNRHPRSCACITNKNELILLTADGRTAEAQGLNLKELTILMGQLKCKSAVNLDGGGSTTMYLSHALFHPIADEGGVVNMPCDNKKFDHEGERKVSNILILKKN